MTRRATSPRCAAPAAATKPAHVSVWARKAARRRRLRARQRRRRAGGAARRRSAARGRRGRRRSWSSRVWARAPARRGDEGHRHLGVPCQVGRLLRAVARRGGARSLESALRFKIGTFIKIFSHPRNTRKLTSTPNATKEPAHGILTNSQRFDANFTSTAQITQRKVLQLLPTSRARAAASHPSGLFSNICPIARTRYRCARQARARRRSAIHPRREVAKMVMPMVSCPNSRAGTLHLYCLMTRSSSRKRCPACRAPMAHSDTKAKLCEYEEETEMSRLPVWHARAHAPPPPPPPCYV